MTVTQKVPAYPGHGGQPSPTAGPRVKLEGEPNYIKGQGTVKEKVFDDTAPIVKTPKPSPRCPTSASKRNYKLGWFGGVSPMLNGTASPRPSTAPPRVKPEAEGTAYMGRGPRMKVIVNEYARRPPTPRQPRVKPEAKDTAEVSKGGRMNNLLHKYGTQALTPRPVPRLKLGSEAIAEVSKGKRMDATIHNYGNNVATPPPEPRVKPEAFENADLDKGKRMETLINKYGRGNLSSKAVPRVKSEGEPNYNLDRGFRMCRLMHEPRSIPSTPRPAPRTNTTQARENAFKGRGSMDLVFKSISEKTFVYVPGQQARPYTRASIA